MKHLRSLSRFFPWLLSVAITLIYLAEINAGWANLDWRSLSLWLQSFLVHIFDWLFFAFFTFCSLVGIRDLTQRKHALLRNYPLIGHIRFLFEDIRPEIRQYLIESDQDDVPFSRNSRELVYQRSKNLPDTRAFGSIENQYREGYQWINHSLAPVPHPKNEELRIMVGGPECAQPYSLSIFNISAMSFGALSANAIMALNKGAKLGGFAHDTGEGSVSTYHERFGGDLIWEIGTGYFGCRNEQGQFDPEKFASVSSRSQIKMIEIKLSQGAKPGHGGLLPGSKVTPEIARARGIPIGEDCDSPPVHSAFDSPEGLMQFIAQLRNLSGGKPVGFKLCVGKAKEWFAIVKAMLCTGIRPDFIVVDGSEGGTGAAPVEFVDHIGMPLREGLALVNASLIGAGLRKDIRIGASGKIISAFDVVRACALGADWTNSARGFMFALGCIQSRSCNTDRCPTGIATQDPYRQHALDPEDKATRVANFHRNTVSAVGSVLAAAGLTHPREVTAEHILQMGPTDSVELLAERILELPEGALLTDNGIALLNAYAPRLGRQWECASPTQWH
jgi:glutamate synthase domain-containing protein 2